MPSLQGIGEAERIEPADWLARTQTRLERFLRTNHEAQTSRGDAAQGGATGDAQVYRPIHLY
jgi:hypothetical protein